MGSSSSSSDDDDHKHKSKKKDHPKALPPPQMPPPGYPATNIPPGYPQPYAAAYPPPPPPGYHPYAQPPPASYYYDNRQRDSGTSCAGCLFSFFLTCLFIFCLSSLITLLLVHPEMPRVHLEKFSVSGLVANDSFFAATWDADLRVENPNDKLRLNFHRVQSGVIYHDDFVSMTLVNPFHVNTKSSTAMKVAMTTNNTVDDQAVMRDLARDRKGGSVTFTLRVDTVTTFTSHWWTRQAYLRIVCDELKVRFSGRSGSGSLADKGPQGCTIYV